MKKGLLLGLGVAFVVALGISSCKKDYICTCKAEVLGFSISADTTFADMKKKDAKDKCNELNKEMGSEGSCELK